MDDTLNMTLLETVNKLPAPDKLKELAKLELAVSSASSYQMYPPAEKRFYEATAADGTPYTAYHWDDAGGQTTSIFFVEDKALILYFDHEIDTNFYAGEEDDEKNQLALYAGMPKIFEQFVYNQEENEMFNMNIDLETGDSIYAASGVVWHDGEKWVHSPQWEALLHDLNLKENYDGGANYCLRWFLKNNPATAETVAAYWEESGYEPEDVAAYVAKFKEVNGS